MASVSDTAMANVITAGFVTGSLADRELAYLTSKTAVGKSFADKAVALGRVPRTPLVTYP